MTQQGYGSWPPPTRGGYPVPHRAGYPSPNPPGYPMPYRTGYPVAGPAGYQGANRFGYPTAPRRRGGGLRRLVAAMFGLVLLVGVALAVSHLLAGGTTATTGGYVNEGYTPPPPDLNPPPLPTVSTVAQAQDTVAKDPIYAQTVPGPVLCKVSPIDLTTATSAQLQTYMTNLVGCLMAVWNQPVAQAGYELPRPPVIVFTTPITTGCGKLPTENAVYCGADQKIYYSTDLPQILPRDLQNARFVVEMIIAHEFGHAVQARTGILISFNGLESMASTKPEKNDWSRRGEMQADCLSGLFINSVSKSAGLTQQDFANIEATARAVGDDTITGKPSVDGNHGLAANREYWVQLGMSSSKVSVCNTFVAPASSVR